jgi:hypothetical protein
MELLMLAIWMIVAIKNYDLVDFKEKKYYVFLEFEKPGGT